VRLLLDTNILIPLMEEDESRVPSLLRSYTSASAPAMYSSAASLWEIAIKVRTGKLALGVPMSEIPLALEQLGIQALRITYEHVLAELIDEVATRDPFDRLLLAQCQVEGMRLVTLDRALAKHPLAWSEK
jgi:PIN domain nuclease of toxin-antitoxin system